MLEKLHNLKSGAVAAIAVLAIMGISYADFVTDAEISFYPFYFLPVAFGAWYGGKRNAVVLSLLCGIGWFLSNYFDGIHFPARIIWVLNIATQIMALLIVSLLVCKINSLLAYQKIISNIDELTSLFNRRAFFDHTLQILALCNRHKRSVTLAFIDVDNFKKVNDVLGHHEGDQALKKIAKLMKESFRSTDIYARIGGDEFLVFLPETGADEAVVLLNKFRERVEKATNYTQCAVTVSIGATFFELAPTTVEELVQKADASMYEAKQLGKNQVNIVSVRL